MQRRSDISQRQYIEQSKQNGWSAFPHKTFACFKGAISPI